MLVTLEKPTDPDPIQMDEAKESAEMETLVAAMGKRLQAEYIGGAIPYLREREPLLWAQLEILDREETVEALLAYERLFFEGLRRYLIHLEGQHEAA